MVQIIAGTFGYYNGRKVVPITNADGPQQFDPELEARLVKKGVAKYVGVKPTAFISIENPEQESEYTPKTDNSTAPDYNENMRLEELKEVAAIYGINASDMRKKAEIIAAIEAAKAGGDEEEPPLLDAVDPI